MDKATLNKARDDAFDRLGELEKAKRLKVIKAVGETKSQAILIVLDGSIECYGAYSIEKRSMSPLWTPKSLEDELVEAGVNVKAEWTPAPRRGCANIEEWRACGYKI